MWILIVWGVHMNNEKLLLKSETEIFNDLINTLPFGIVIMDQSNVVINVNHKFMEYFQLEEDLLGKPFRLQDLECEILEELIKDRAILVSIRSKIYSMNKIPLTQNNLFPDGYALVFQLYDKHNVVLDKFQQIANVDYLTKLANRGGLYQYFDSLDKSQTMHFLFLDIDNFKIVNDVYGHTSGDELLVMVATKITNCIPGTFVSRIGGDEFVIILSGTLREEEVTNIARNILAEVSNSEYPNDILYMISISIGIVLNQKLDCNLDDILYKCDSAMYRAKKNGKNQFIIFNTMEDEVMEQKRIEEEMHHALANGEFVVYLQPKMNMLTSKLYGAEALVRWEHPTEGLWLPGKFIPIFENNGFIVELDMFVFEEVCKLKKLWKNEVFGHTVISVNMSRLHFYRENFVERLLSITNKYEVNTNEIEIEITEGIFLNNNKENLTVVKKLKDAGFFVSVDDFGSGYSSLNLLKDIPADILKIDREFLQLSEDDVRSKTVIKNVIAMGKDLKLELIAEGVETLDQVLFLTSCGCELGQGFYYSKPLPVDQFVEYAKKYTPLNKKCIKFSFHNNLWDDNQEFKGVYNGDHLTFCEGVIAGTSAIYLPGGGVHQNVVKLPTSVLCSDSYTISMWVKACKSNYWTSLFFLEYEYGFASLVPCSWEGTSTYRVKDRDINGWYDTTCCSLMLNEWIHLAITYDAKSEIVRYYGNGKQIGYLEHVPTLRVLKQIFLGGDVFQNSFQGYVCDLMISDTAKSEKEIWSIFEQYISHPSYKHLWVTTEKNEKEDELKQEN